MEFEWDLDKAARNLEWHGVSLPEATTVFDDSLSVAVPDPDHSFEEQRYIIVGSSHRNRLLIVAYTERGERIRIITARELTRREREAYEQGDYL
jgi:uncharacterized protein